MIVLFTYPAAFGEFSASPFCTKAAWLLNAAGEDWRREDVLDPRKMPHGKLPVIRTEDRLVADSDAIRAFLEDRGARFEEGLSDVDRANARAFIRMAEEHLYFHLLQDRWGSDAVWAEVREAFFSEVPRPVRGLLSGIVRRDLLKAVRAQGTGRLTEPERMARIEPDLQAISTRLWQGAYLFGARPSAADASVAAMLSGMRATPVETRLQQRVATDTQICNYIDRVTQAFG
ncbi:glutathione S-transferase family protein [Sulfitobacter sp. D35]|uniref:glutathione S-transferase family protein n=1 Tax=Sulfitobacter sp. D35 TaxID=3083252 RepID=UPI00296EE41F|nr:glutathione S-transferase family protein [Sulfitobacter sp. D35]MDW4498142.1 glutathione S-transferase family protein [Sulfitobacter sp. D35]